MCTGAKDGTDVEIVLVVKAASGCVCADCGDPQRVSPAVQAAAAGDDRHRAAARAASRADIAAGPHQSAAHTLFYQKH
jgi:hypothetical protein